MKRPQFKLRDLLVATLMVAAGFGCLQWFFLGQERLSIIRVVALPFGIPLITAGMMKPFHRVKMGAYTGFIGQIVALLIALLVSQGWERAMRNLRGDPWSQAIVGLTAFLIVLTLFELARRLVRFVAGKSPIGE